MSSNQETGGSMILDEELMFDEEDLNRETQSSESDQNQIAEEEGGGEEGELNERAAKAYLFQVTSVSDNAPDRQIAIRCILNVVENSKQGDEHDEAQVRDLFALINDKFAQDSDPLVRAELLEVLPALCMHCSHQSPWFEPYVHDTLLPLLPTFLNDLNTQVRKTCQAAIVILLEQKLLQPEFVEKSICPVLVSLSDDFRSEDVRVEAVSLLCKIISQALSRENAVSHFLPKFTSLCQDSLFHIRKVCASSIGGLSKLLGSGLTERVLVPHLISLSQDSVWGVRKACAEVFTDVSNQCSMCVRRTQLASVFIVLLADSSRWVQSAAFQSLGPFISTFADANRTGLKWYEGQLSYEQPAEDVKLERDGEESVEVPDNVIVPTIHPPPTSGHVSPHLDPDYMDGLGGLMDEDDSMNTASSDSQTSVSPTSSTPQLTDQPNQECGEKSLEDEFASFRFWQLPLDVDERNESSSGQLASGEEDKTLDTFIGRYYKTDVPIGEQTDGHADTPRISVVDTDTHSKGGAVAEAHKGQTPTKNSYIDSDDSDSDDEPIIFNVSSKSGGDRNDRSTESDNEFNYQDIIPQALLDNFISMVEPYRAQTVESDISRHCAFNLPAVALTMGRRHWHQLKPTYLSLANDMQWKVRRTLAFSIHELAAILGHDITVSDLLPVFQSFVRDLDEVRIGVLKHLYDFIKLLDMPTRKCMLLSMADFLQTDNIRNWRFRLLLAEQLVLLCELYAIEDVNEYLSPIAMTLAIDKVSVIRKATYLLLAKILGYFYAVERNLNDSPTMDITNSFTQDIIKGFACSQRWARRQTYVYTLDEMLKEKVLPDAELSRELLPAMLRLAHDRIPNVRISLATVISQQMHRLGHCHGVDNAIHTLAQDTDVDCKYFFNKQSHIVGMKDASRNRDETEFGMDPESDNDNDEIRDSVAAGEAAQRQQVQQSEIQLHDNEQTVKFSKTATDTED